MWLTAVLVAAVVAFAALLFFLGVCLICQHKRRALKQRRAREQQEESEATPGPLPYGEPNHHRGATTASPPYSRVIEARFHERMYGNLIVGVPLDEITQGGSAEHHGPLQAGLCAAGERGEVSLAVSGSTPTRHCQGAARLPDASTADASTRNGLSAPDTAFDLACVLPTAEEGHPNASSAVDGCEEEGSGEGERPPLHERLVADGRLMLLLSPNSAAQADQQGPDTSGLVRVTDEAAVHAARHFNTRLVAAPLDRSSLTFHFTDVTPPPSVPGSGGRTAAASLQDRDGQTERRTVLQREAQTLWIRRPSAVVYGHSIPYASSLDSLDGPQAGV